jgi:hypothetical protein
MGFVKMATCTKNRGKKMLKLVILTNSARGVGERAGAKKARVSPRSIIITD